MKKDKKNFDAIYIFIIVALMVLNVRMAFKLSSCKELVSASWDVTSDVMYDCIFGEDDNNLYLSNPIDNE